MLRSIFTIAIGYFGLTAGPQFAHTHNAFGETNVIVYVGNKMVNGCSVIGCTYRLNGSARERRVKFFRFPTSKHKRRSWIRTLNRRNWVPKANSFVCSEHFVSEWHGDDRDEVNYAPSLFVYKHKHVDQVRAERAHRREITKVRFFNEKIVFFKEPTINYTCYKYRTLRNITLS